jgi:hypothetical protein
MSRFIRTMLLSVCLLAPAMARAEPPRHEWNEEHENDAWQRYQKEKHIKAHEWGKASKREQARYWKWRDAHRD